VAGRSTESLDGALHVAMDLQSWLGTSLFVASVVWAVFGNIVLTYLLKKRGIAVPGLLQGCTFLVYSYYRPPDSSRGMDRLALSVAVAFVVLIVMIIFL
jgi:hypothetical protein